MLIHIQYYCFLGHIFQLNRGCSGHYIVVPPFAVLVPVEIGIVFSF